MLQSQTDNVRSALSTPDAWQSDLLAIPDERSIGMALVACSRLMLPYWESHCPRDDKMECVVSAMSDWALEPTAESQKRVMDVLDRVAVKCSGYLSPVWSVTPIGSDCPGDHAGDSIVAAANAIAEIGQPCFHEHAAKCLERATRTVSEMLGHRQPDDESTDFWTVALERIRVGIVEELVS